MRITQPLAPERTYTIEIATGWVVVVDSISGTLRAFLRGVLTHEHSGCAIEARDADFGFAPFTLLPETTLEAHAEAQMKRHVPPPASPNRFRDRVAGHDALGFTWTDGVLEIATWFMEPWPGQGVRIDHSVASAISEGYRGVRPRDDASALLATLTWTAP